MGNGSTIKTSLSFKDLIWYHFIEKKLNTGLGYLLVFVMGTAVAYGTTLLDYRIGPIIVGIVGSIMLVIAFLKFPYFGFYFTIAYSAVIVELMRLIDLPFGIFIDPMTALVLLGTILKYDLSSQIDKKFWTNPISIALYILFGYYLIEAFNPAMYSRLGWISFFRKQISFYIFYFIAYCLLNSKERIINFLYFTIGLSTVLAAYACKQQWLGYADFEMRAILKGGPMAYQLLFQGGLLRKFSTLADPATSGILFAATAMQCIILLIRDSNKKRRLWWLIAAVFNILGYSFSGTRTATLMIVAAIGFYSIATLYEKRTLKFLIFSILIFYGLLVAPYQNVVTNRIRTTFDGTKDASAAVRDYDRHLIQPYLFDHPMGGGIYTSGAEGPKYNPGHPLETFQPDSGYAKTLAEQGEIGLALLLLTYLIVMRQGIRNFYRARDSEIAGHYIALLVMLFSILVGQYAQMAISQYPILLYYYAFLVVFYKLIQYDSPETNNENSQTR
jgi:putative inorganic carbon (hco3(-)) transporter